MCVHRVQEPDVRQGRCLCLSRGAARVSHITSASFTSVDDLATVHPSTTDPALSVEFACTAWFAQDPFQACQPLHSRSPKGWPFVPYRPTQTELHELQRTHIQT